LRRAQALQRELRWIPADDLAASRQGAERGAARALGTADLSLRRRGKATRRRRVSSSLPLVHRVGFALGARKLTDRCKASTADADAALVVGVRRYARRAGAGAGGGLGRS